MKHQLNLPFPLLSDEDEAVIKRYGLLHERGNNESDISRPANILLDGQGIIRWAAFSENIRINVAPEVILEAAKQLR